MLSSRGFRLVFRRACCPQIRSVDAASNASIELLNSPTKRRNVMAGFLRLVYLQQPNDPRAWPTISPRGITQPIEQAHAEFFLHGSCDVRVRRQRSSAQPMVHCLPTKFSSHATTILCHLRTPCTRFHVPATSLSPSLQATPPPQVMLIFHSHTNNDQACSAHGSLSDKGHSSDNRATICNRASSTRRPRATGALGESKRIQARFRLPGCTRCRNGVFWRGSASVLTEP